MLARNANRSRTSSSKSVSNNPSCIRDVLLGMIGFVRSVMCRANSGFKLHCRKELANIRSARDVHFLEIPLAAFLTYRLLSGRSRVSVNVASLRCYPSHLEMLASSEGR